MKIVVKNSKKNLKQQNEQKNIQFLNKNMKYILMKKLTLKQ